MRSLISSSKGIVASTDHDNKAKCFVCHETNFVVSIDSCFPIFESEAAQRPQVHFCYKCAGAVSTSIAELLFDLVIPHSRVDKKRILK